MDKNRIINIHQRYLENSMSLKEHQEWKTVLSDPEQLEVVQELMNDNWYSMSADDDLNLKGNRSEEIYDSIIAQTEKSSFIKRLWKPVAIAASIALIGGLSLLFFNNETKIVEEPTVKTSEILPGKNRATLTLADGSKISLTNAQNGELAKQAGIRVRKAADGQLIYDVVNSGSATASSIYNTIETPIGGEYQVDLPDGTKVWLNAASSLSYPVKFIGGERRVTLVGEGYFEVVHDENSPFKVESAGQTVEVLGTHFNITAYQDEKIIKTTLLKGSVRIAGSGKSQMLVPGQQAQFTGNSITVSDAVDIEEVIAWKNGYFYFNEDLHSIMTKIARWYDVEVVYQVKSEAKLAFGGKMSRSRNLPALLKIMERTGKIHFKIEGRRVIVTD